MGQRLWSASKRPPRAARASRTFGFPGGHMLRFSLTRAQPAGTGGRRTERGAGEGRSDAWPGSRLLLRRNPRGCTGPGPTAPNTCFSQRQSADRISCAGSVGSFSFSTQTDKRNSRATRKLPHGGTAVMWRAPEVGEGVTHGQMPTNYSVMLSRARPRMPDSGRASLSLSTNVRELPKPVMTQPAPPRAQAATPPYRISPLGGRGEGGEQN